MVESKKSLKQTENVKMVPWSTGWCEPHPLCCLFGWSFSSEKDSKGLSGYPFLICSSLSTAQSIKCGILNICIYPNLFQEWLIFGVEQLSPSNVSMFNTRIIPKDLSSLDHLHHYLHLNGHRSFFGHRAPGPTGRARFGKESPCQFWCKY